VRRESRELGVSSFAEHEHVEIEQNELRISSHQENQRENQRGSQENRAEQKAQTEHVSVQQTESAVIPADLVLLLRSSIENLNNKFEAF